MKRIALYASALALVFAYALPQVAHALPQATYASETPVDAKNSTFWVNLSKQLTTSLESPIEEIKTQTLQHINFFATHHSDKVDLTATVPELLAIYDNDRNEGYRIMALAALHAIGNHQSMIYLSQTVRHEQSPRVRRLTLAALSEYVKAHPAL